MWNERMRFSSYTSHTQWLATTTVCEDWRIIQVCLLQIKISIKRSWSSSLVRWLSGVYTSKFGFVARFVIIVFQAILFFSPRDLRLPSLLSWDLGSCCMLARRWFVLRYRRFETTYKLPLQVSNWLLKMGLTCRETSVTIYYLTQRKLPEEQRPQCFIRFVGRQGHRCIQCVTVPHTRWPATVLYRHNTEN